MTKPTRCQPFCDRRDWRGGQPDKNGNIKTTCERCGAFIGYRPAERKQPVNLKDK